MNDELDAQQIACYCVSSFLQLSAVVAVWVYLSKTLMRTQYKHMQNVLIHIYFSSLAVSVLCSPKGSYLYCLIVSSQNLDNWMYQLIAFETIFKYTIPSSMLIMNIVMSYSMFQKTSRLIKNVWLTSLILLVYIIASYMAQTVCFFSAEEFCPQFVESELVLSSWLFYLIQSALIISPYVAILILGLMESRMVVVEYNEYEETEQLITEKQNELWIIQQKRLTFLQVLTILASFLVDNVFQNAVQPFFSSEAPYLCWIEMVLTMISMALSCYVFCIKNKMLSLALLGQ